MQTFNSRTVTDWNELEGFYKSLQNRCQTDLKPKWIFRGQRMYSSTNPPTHVLETTLERAFRSSGIEGESRRRRERDLIREFQRKFHLYNDRVPSRHDITEWLSLMQHHGAPTRLLDWSYSFWVALYFAINQLDCSNHGREKAEIWALDIKWFDRRCRNKPKLKSDRLLTRAIKRRVYLEYADPLAQSNNSIIWHLMHRPRRLIMGMNSFRLNERITAQQGVFIVPGDTRVSFMDNLAGVPDSREHIHVCTLDLTVERRNIILAKLLDMNVNSSVLFAGLDGFAQSLRTRLALSLGEIRSVGIP